MKKRGMIKENTISKNTRGQVWVETVIYLLIAFAMMGLVLSFVKPKIEEMRDKAIIEQSLEIIKEIDNSIEDIVRTGTGNKRLIELGVKKGEFTIDSTNDLIIFEMETEYQYSQKDEPVYIGKIKAITQGENQYSKIILERDFSDEYDLIYENVNTDKTLIKSSNPYNLFIENRGPGGTPIRTVINFEVQ